MNLAEDSRDQLRLHRIKRTRCRPVAGKESTALRIELEMLVREVPVRCSDRMSAQRCRSNLQHAAPLHLVDNETLDGVGKRHRRPCLALAETRLDRSVFPHNGEEGSND